MANVFRRKSLSNHELTSGSPVKIVVLGKNGVGKSALTVRLVTRRFIGEYDPDLECTCQYLSTCNGGSSRNAEIMDTSNRTSHSRVEKCVHWADCIILLYAVNDWASFAAIIAIKNILDGFRDSQLKPLFIVANKKDITSGREVPEAVGSKFASKSGCPFYEISVRESYQEVEKVFYDAIDLCRKCIYLKEHIESVYVGGQLSASRKAAIKQFMVKFSSKQITEDDEESFDQSPGTGTSCETLDRPPTSTFKRRISFQRRMPKLGANRNKTCAF